MAIHLLKLHELAASFAKELFAAWRVDLNSKENSLWSNEEEFSVLSRNNSYGFKIHLRRKTMKSFMSCNYKQFTHSILVDQSILCSSSYVSTSVIAALFKRNVELVDAVENVHVTRQRHQLEEVYNREIREIDVQLADRKTVIRERIAQYESEGFAEVIVVAEEDEDTVIMSGQSNNNSDFDSSDSENDCEACDLADSMCIGCRVRRTELTMMAAQRTCDHICRFKVENCGLTDKEAALAVGHQMSRREETMFASVCITGAQNQANMIVDRSLKAATHGAIRVVIAAAKTILQPPGFESFVPVRAFEEQSTYFLDLEENLMRPSVEVSASGRLTPSPFKRQCIADDNFVAGEGSEVSRDWWVDSPSTAFVHSAQKLLTPISRVTPWSLLGGGNSGVNSEDAVGVVNVAANDGVDVADEEEDSLDSSSEDETSSVDFSDEEFVVSDAEIATKVKHYGAMRQVMLTQAREIKALDERETAARAALAAHHEKIQLRKECEHFLRRDRVNERHYTTYLRMANLSQSK